MEPAGTALRSTLDMLEWRRPAVPLLANFNAERYTDPATIPIVLERQLSSPVRWADCVWGLRELGCDTFWELGPKRALTGMMKELVPQATALAVPGPNAVEQLPVS
jgi:[acyl-carrier-protein] S-malonyltransferase